MNLHFIRLRTISQGNSYVRNIAQKQLKKVDLCLFGG
jgi:hypothetical protein